jgi:glycosyltransferase involved in cell wall biosynthesis
MGELVTVTIPTYNSEKTLRTTLESVKAQTYKNIEVTIVDSYSKDGTCEIAKEFGVRILSYDGTLLGARGLGVQWAQGKYVLLLDSDQVLEKTAIERAVAKMKEFDMLWLYERSYQPHRLLEYLYDADRQLVQKYSEDFIEPIGGVILPRFYKKDILVQAFKHIPKAILPLCVAHDHAIIYYEARKQSDKVGKLDNAVWHMEPWSWTNLMKKTYRYGITTRKLIENNAYPEIIKSKNRMRKMEKGDLKLSIESNILRVARGVPYKLGYWFGG